MILPLFHYSYNYLYSFGLNDQDTNINIEKFFPLINANDILDKTQITQFYNITNDIILANNLNDSNNLYDIIFINLSNTYKNSNFDLISLFHIALYTGQLFYYIHNNNLPNYIRDALILYKLNDFYTYINNKNYNILISIFDNIKIKNI